MASDPVELLTQPAVPATERDGAALARMLYGLTGRVTALTGERDRNYLIEDATGRFVLKIANPAEGRTILELQQAALWHLARTDPGLPVPRPLSSLKGEPVALSHIAGMEVPVRVVTFLEGALVREGFTTPRLRASIAGTLARLHRALEDFDHPVAARNFLWDVTRLPDLRLQASHLELRKRQVVTRWMDRFEREVSPRLRHLRHQVIHGDFNRANLLTGTDPEIVTGIIDFSDMVRAPLVADVAIAGAYQSLFQPNPTAVIADLAAAYHEHHPLDSVEVELVADLAVARLVQSLVISAWRADLHPANREYILSDAKPVWDSLLRLDGVPPENMLETVRRACGA